MHVRALKKLLCMICVAGLFGVGRIGKDEMKSRAGFHESTQ
jgi:hypothetical protein